MQQRDHAANDCTRNLSANEIEAPLHVEQPRVRMLSFYFPPAYSGSAVQAYNLSRCLLRRGVHAEIVSANLTESAAAEDLDGLVVHRLPLLKTQSLQIPTFMASLTWHLLRNRRDFEIVHAHGTYQHSVASIVCRLLGKKSILKIAMGNSDIAFERQGKMWGRINRFFVKRFDRYIATSEEVYRECLSQGLEPARVLLVPNGVDVNRFRPAQSDEERRHLRRELRLPDKPIACFVGVLDARKNIDGILRIWKSVARSNVAGHLVLVGPDPAEGDGRQSAYGAQLRRFIVEEGLGESVTFVGRQADVASFLRCADVFLFPSHREGMPNVLLEAMASGLACVASAIGGSTDLIDNGRSGYLLPAGDEEGMAVAVTNLLTIPARARDLGAAARKTMVERFSITATAERYARLYGELLSERHSRAARASASASDKA